MKNLSASIMQYSVLSARKNFFIIMLLASLSSYQAQAHEQADGSKPGDKADRAARESKGGGGGSSGGGHDGNDKDHGALTSGSSKKKKAAAAITYSKLTRAGEIDMRGNNGLARACSADIASFCKTDNAAELADLQVTVTSSAPTPPPIDLRLETYTCLLNHVQEINVNCKDKLRNSAQGRRLAVKKACYSEINSQCSGLLGKEGEAPNAGSKASAGPVIECLIAKKPGITSDSCLAALNTFEQWLKGFSGQINMNANTSGQNSINGVMNSNGVKIENTENAK